MREADNLYVQNVMKSGSLNLLEPSGSDLLRDCHNFTFLYFNILLQNQYLWAGIAQLVQWLRTDWTVPESNPCRGEILWNRPHWPCGLPSLLYSEYQVIPGGKAAGAWRWSPTLCTAEVKERVELYFYSPLGLRGLL